jgi:nitroreductase
MAPNINTDVWNISENEFPSEGTISDKLKFILKYVILAPSGHNTQPWLFKIVDNKIELYADRTRSLPVVDHDDRELTISCGAALYHMQLAIRHFGFEDIVEIAIEENGDDLLARIRIGGRRQSRDDDYLLFYAITKRRTNRMKFEDKEISDSLLSRFQAAASENGVWLHIAKEEQIPSLVDLIAEGDRIQMSDKSFRRELASWTHSNRSRSKDGIPGYAFGIGDLMSYVGPFIVRTFDIGKGQAAKDIELASGSPILAVLGTAADEPQAWLKTGISLANMLLVARAEKIWCSFLNQPIEVAALRDRVKSLTTNNGVPQLLIRMGYGDDVKPTPRRSVEEVIY